MRRSGAEAFLEGWRAGWALDPPLTVSEWADKHRMLVRKASSEPGQWRTSRTPYLREIMDALSPTHPTQRVVFMKGAQIGGTEAGNNWLGYIIHHSPGPVLMVQPTVEMAMKVSKQRIRPMIEASAVLRARVREPRSRDAGNTIMTKEFDGGILILTGANSGVGLRSMPIRYLFCDEVDAYPGDVDGEGDPVGLAEKRTSTFPRRKVFLVSTPGVKGRSRIENEFLATDQRRYFVPCPACGHMDWIRWENILWEKDHPETAALRCVNCGVLSGEEHKAEMLEHGEWRPTSTVVGDNVSAGYHLSALYSPWKTWRELVDEFIKFKDDPFKRKQFVNTVFGETWEERGDSVEPHDLLKDGRREEYKAEIPHGVGVVVAAVDVQGDRLEVKVKGYGSMEESWLLAYEQIMGDPGTEKPWHDLDRFLRQIFKHETGRTAAIECTAIDSGGHFTDRVYRFCKARLHRRVFAIKGVSGQTRGVIAPPTRTNRYKTPLYSVYVDTAKEMVLSRLHIKEPGPGFMHLPQWVDETYVLGITAEKAITKYVKGRGSTRVWEKIRPRNEPLDLEAYCLAALYILGPSTVRALPQLAAAMSRPLPPSGGGQPSPATPTPKRRVAPRRPREWADGWK